MCSIIEFLNNNSGAIQALLVLVLVSVTIWYAISTKKMSEIMVKQYFSSTKPYLYPAREVDRNYIPNFNPQNNTSVQLRFLFTNLGNTSVKYFADEITLHGSSINPQKISTILFPNQKGYITSNIYQTNTNIGYGDGLEGSIKVIFWATDVQEEKYFFYRKFTLAPGLIITIDAEEFGML